VARLRPCDAASLADLFAGIMADASARFFHPHPFSRADAARIAAHEGEDLYAGLFAGERLRGYGMLRGFDAGFAIPSLGIYIEPGWRGRGAGRFLMTHLHAAARQRQCRAIRLKTYPENEAALHLYQSLGYRFRPTLEAGQLVGELIL